METTHFQINITIDKIRANYACNFSCINDHTISQIVVIFLMAYFQNYLVNFVKHILLVSE